MWVCEALWGSGFGWKGWAGVSVGVPSPKDLSSLTLPGHPSGSSPFPPALRMSSCHLLALVPQQGPMQVSSITAPSGPGAPCLLSALHPESPAVLV